MKARDGLMLPVDIGRTEADTFPVNAEGNSFGGKPLVNTQNES